MQQRPTQQVKMNPATTITALLVQLQVIGDFVKTNTIEYMESFFLLILQIGEVQTTKIAQIQIM